MKFLSMIRIEENAGQVPSEQLMQDMGQLFDDLRRAGKLISPAGLRPTAEGVRLRLPGGQISMRDGPFSETGEVTGGQAILEAASKEEAIELTCRFMKVHADDSDFECELRRLDGPEFGCQP